MALCALLFGIEIHDDGFRRHAGLNVHGCCSGIVTGSVCVLGRRSARSLRRTVGLGRSIRLVRPLALGLSDLRTILCSSLVAVGLGCRCTVVRGAIGAIGTVGTVSLGRSCGGCRAVIGRSVALGTCAGINAARRGARGGFARRRCCLKSLRRGRELRGKGSVRELIDTRRQNRQRIEALLWRDYRSDRHCACPLLIVVTRTLGFAEMAGHGQIIHFAPFLVVEFLEGHVALTIDQALGDLAIAVGFHPCQTRGLRIC